MPAETDKFIIASFALWAGDFEYFERLLREYSSPSEVGPIVDEAERPEDFIRATGALRLRQLWQKRGEFKKLAAEYASQNAAISDIPSILETKHLRATLWRTGAREFLMQGYLTELSWEEGLFGRARRLAAVVGGPKGKGMVPTADMFEAGAEGDYFHRLGGAWVVAENPFIQVELTDLGLVEATGIWTGQLLPETSEVITAPFLNVLESLNASTSAP